MKSISEQVDTLHVRVFPTRQAMGMAAGQAVRDKIKELLAEQDQLRIVFAAAPSQNEMLDFLANAEGIDWSRIDVFHMDEYVGLPADAPQRFAHFLTTKLFANVTPRTVNLIVDDVPEEALTLTIPTLLSGNHLFCVVPGKSKHKAITATLNGLITTACPASILRQHPDCTLYMDADAYGQPVA